MTAAVLLAAAALMALAAWRLRAIAHAPATGRHAVPALSGAQDEAAAERWLMQVRATRSQPPADLFPALGELVPAVPPPPAPVATQDAVAAEVAATRPWADDTGTFTAIVGEVR